MKRLLAIASVLLPIWVFSQGFGSFSHDQPFLAKDVVSSGPVDDFPPLSTIGYRWVASDIGSVNDLPATNWVDRIQGFRLISSTNSPLATTNGVTFFRTNRLWLESTLNANWGEIDQGATANSNKWSYLIVCSPTTLAGDVMTILSPPGAGASFFSLHWDGEWHNAGADLGPYTPNKTVEFYTVNSAGEFGNYKPQTWKNGAFNIGNASVSNVWALVGQNGLLTATLGHIGTIKELVIWTNTGMNSTNYIGLVHQYVTNHYSNF